MDFISFIKNILYRFTVKFSINSKRVAVVNLAIELKRCGYYALIPNNLDLEAHIEKYPLTDYKFRQISGKIKSYNDNGTYGSNFDIEGLIHIIDLVSYIPAKNKDSITDDGFVSINSTIIRNYFKDYKCYLDYLIDTEVLICDESYINGEKSLGFKFSPAFENSILNKYYYRRFRYYSPQPIPEERYSSINERFEENTLLHYPYLTYWYNQKRLFIDNQIAEDYAYTLMQKKIRLGRDSWDVNKDKWDYKNNDFCKKNPKTQYNAIMRNINNIDIGAYDAMIDTNVHRLHSALTNMQKKFRNFLTYDRQSLVSLDISNSQPYLLCILFNPMFWEHNSCFPLNISMLPNNIKSLFNQEHLSTIKNYLREQLLDNEELITYKEKVSKGIIYDYIAEVSNERTDTHLVRDDAKVMMLIVFFSKNKFFHQKGAELKRLFAELYPQIYGLIELIKRDNHVVFACLLQAIESKIILHMCCQRIWNEKPQKVPIFTIHDSIATTLEHKSYVKSVMADILTTCVGIAPFLKEEKWLLSNLNEV